MNKEQTIVIYALIFIAILAIIFIGGRYVRRIPSAIAKKINQVSFSIAVVSGVLLYIVHYTVFLYLFFISLVCFFLFFNYKEEG